MPRARPQTRTCGVPSRRSAGRTAGRVVLFLLLLGSLGTRLPDPLAAESQDRARLRMRAREIAVTLLMRTMQALTRYLREGGPIAAVRGCAEVAQAIRRDVEKQYGVFVKRTSDRIRNPADAPEPWERDLLQTVREITRRTGTRPREIDRVITLDGRTYYVYARPLVISRLCLHCHGDPQRDLTPEVRRALRQHFPEDRATGYRIGDLRGLVLVRIPLSPPDAEP